MTAYFRQINIQLYSQAIESKFHCLLAYISMTWEIERNFTPLPSTLRKHPIDIPELPWRWEWLLSEGHAAGVCATEGFCWTKYGWMVLTEREALSSNVLELLGLKWLSSEWHVAGLCFTERFCWTTYGKMVFTHVLLCASKSHLHFPHNHCRCLHPSDWWSMCDYKTGKL